VIVDAGDQVSEPGLRVDTVELRGADQEADHRRAFARAIGAAEQPRRAQRSLGGVGRYADPAVVEEAGERRAALEQVLDRPRPPRQVSRSTTSGAIVARRCARRFLAAAPLIMGSWSKIASIRLTAPTASAATSASLRSAFRPISASTKKLALACAQHAASSTPRLAVRLVEPVEATIGGGLQDAGEAVQMTPGIRAAPIRRIEEQGGRRAGPEPARNDPAQESTTSISR